MSISQVRVINQIVAIVKDARCGDANWLGSSLADKYGFTLLGNGQGSATIVHPFEQDMVIKVSQNMADGALDYMTYIFMQQRRGNNSKHWPLINQMHFEDKFVVTIMERLQPVHSFHDYEVLKEQMRCGVGIDAEMDKLLEEFGTPDDTHGANFMQRTDGTVVATDPYYRRAMNPHWHYRKHIVNGKVEMHVNQVELQPDHSDRDLIRDWRPVQRPLHMNGPNLQQLPRDKVVEDFARQMQNAFLIQGHLMRPADEIRAMRDEARFGHAGHRLEWDPERRQFLINGAPIRNHHQIDLCRGHRGGELIRAAHHWFDQQEIRRLDRDLAPMMWVEAAKPEPRRDKRAFIDRTKVAPTGSPAAIRAEKEDRMLRVRSEHDHQPRGKGLQRALLPQRGPRRVPPAWGSFVSRVAEAEGRLAGVTGRAAGPPQGLHAGHPGNRSSVAAQVVHQHGPDRPVRLRVQPEVQPGHPAGVPWAGINRLHGKGTGWVQA